MKPLNQKLAAMTRSVLRGYKRYGEHNLMHPVRDWYIGIIFFVGVTVLGGWWAATVYLRYSEASLYDGVTTTEENVVYRASLVDAALKEVAARKARFHKLESFFGGVPAATPAVVEPAPTSTPAIASSSAAVTDEPAAPSEETDPPPEMPEEELPSVPAN